MNNYSVTELQLTMPLRVALSTFSMGRWDLLAAKTTKRLWRML